MKSEKDMRPSTQSSTRTNLQESRHQTHVPPPSIEETTDQRDGGVVAVWGGRLQTYS